MSEILIEEPEGPRFDTADNELGTSISRSLDEMFVEAYCEHHGQAASALITDEVIAAVYEHARGSSSVRDIIAEEPTEAGPAPDNVIPLFPGNTDERSSHQSTPDEK